jgi:hypothetical protein
LAVVLLLHSASVHAYSLWGGRIEVHGFVQSTMRALSDDYQYHYWYLSQWSNVLNLETEISLAPDGWGPFDLIEGYVRVEGRYECIYRGCGFNTYRHFGDRADRAPARNWSEGQSTGFSGLIEFEEPTKIQDGGTKLLGITQNPLLAAIAEFGGTNLDATFEPILKDRFTWRKIDTSVGQGNFQQGPWQPRSDVSPNHTLRKIPNPTLGLPLRPAVPDFDPDKKQAQGLFAPSRQLRKRLGKMDTMDLNFSQTQLEWNRGASQDEGELKEAYLDLELFDGRLWVRAGKQNIVWGKTELFRTTDQFNPQDIALASLPSLEESRIPLWSLRGVWSFYDVGPFNDVRLELAANYDDFEPTDLGRCGEPYTVWLVCGKPGGALAHGLLGLGLPGEERPDDPWNDVSGIEVGARLEWRWDRFSFALTDFYGYNDGPYLNSINFYERRVDVETGMPLNSLGGPLLPENAVDFHPSNRQLFDVVCSATVGVAASAPGLGGFIGDNCILNVPNIQPISSLFGFTLGGENPLGLPLGTPGDPDDPYLLVFLNEDVGDAGGVSSNLNSRLTPEQQALLGCGPFYMTDCQADGIDLFNAEGSVLVQSFQQVAPIPPVATRFVDGRVVVLPGARSPSDLAYAPGVDGCAGPDDPTNPRDDDCALSNGGMGANLLVNPLTGQPFENELAAVSFNFQMLLVGLNLSFDAADPPEEGEECVKSDPVTCGLQRAVVAVTGVQRPEMRAAGNGQFGRRDLVWQGGGEATLNYDKRNVLGFSADFAEDYTKTNWGVEFTWFADNIFGSNKNRQLHQKADALNLTVSVDRPTFVNFLNANRTFFFNSQWFFGYVPEFDSTFPGNGPFSVLSTFTAATGYFQDRLLPSMTWVHDYESASGGAILSNTYRFTEVFSVNFGVALFYGSPQRARIPYHQLAISNQGPTYSADTAYTGLSAISERDEVFLTVRYTF